MRFYSNGQIVMDEKTLIDFFWNELEEDFGSNEFDDEEWSKEELREEIRSGRGIANFSEIQVCEEIAKHFPKDNE